MHNIFKDYIKEEVKKITLSPEEKNAIRAKLLHFIKTNPVRNTDVVRHQYQRSLFITSFIPFIRPMGIALAILLMISGSASLAAEGSLPGEILYPVKVGVNETVRGWLAVSEKSEVEWRARLIERRIKEAETLALQGKMNAEVRAQLESRVDAETEKFAKHIANFEAKNELDTAIEASSKTETFLNVHEEILEALASEKKTTNEIAPFAVKIKHKKHAIAEKRAHLEGKISGKTGLGFPKEAAEGKMRAAEEKIAEVKKFLALKKASFSTDTMLRAEARLKNASDMLAEGKTKIEIGAFGDAFILFQSATRLAQETKLLVEAKNELKINILFTSDHDASYSSTSPANEDKDSEEKEEMRDEHSEKENSIKTRTEVNVESENESSNTKTEGGVDVDLGL